MEKRKSKLTKILTQFDALVDEKLTLEDNLKLLFDQLYPYVDRAKTIENVRHRDLNEILKYELKILKKLTDLNTDLESFIDDKFVCEIVMEESNDGTNNLVETTGLCYGIYELSEEKPEMGLSVQQQEPVISEQCVSNEFPTELHEPSTMIIPFEFSEFEMKNEIPENDIDSLRNCLKNFSQTLGLNQQSFSNMEDYYEKSSDSCSKEEQINPSPVVLPEVPSDVLEEVVTAEVEIPVRDTCISLDELHSNNGQINQCDGSKSELIEMCCKTSNNSLLSSTTCIDNLEKKSCNENYRYCSDINVNVDATVSDTRETDCILSSIVQVQKSDNLLYETQTKLDLPTKPSDLKFSDVSKNNRDHNPSCSNTKQKNNHSTALTKLNNYRSKKSSNTVEITVQLPDISLKPIKASSFLGSKSISSMNNQQSRKIKKVEIVANIPSKSNTIWSANREEKDVFYEPARKMTPVAGDECAFSHIESPSEFYIHVNDEETALIDSLTEQINEYFNGSVSTYRSKQFACSDIGKFCFSYIPEYIGWFRVEVLDWYLDDGSMDVLVQLVDYGNKRKASYKDLRKMEKEICDIPLLAIRCHFPLVISASIFRMYPYGSTPTNKLSVWPEIAVEALIGLSKNNGQQNMFKIMYALEEANSVAIDLLSPFEEGEGNTLGQILLDMGLAVQIFDEMNGPEDFLTILTDFPPTQQSK